MRIPHRRAGAVLRFGCLAWMLVSVTATARAQVVRDGSIGPGLGANEPTGPDYQIPASLGDRRGDNLFHSFQRFDLQIGDAATFTGSGARHILARVTGGAASSINGRINAEANLFLMNPAGIVFRENASINVTGSFFATTADYIKLGNDGRFAATTNANDSILNISDPSAFGFLTPNPKAIRVLSTNFLEPGGKTLGLIGGDVTVDNGVNINAEDFQIHSVRSGGEAPLTLPNATNGLRYPYIDAGDFTQRGAVAIGSAAAPGDPPASPVAVTAKRVVIRGGSLVMTGAHVNVEPAAPGDGVSVHLDGALTMNQNSSFLAFPSGDMTGSTAVEIVAGEATLGSASAVGTFTSVPGAGGDVRLTINGALRVVDSASIVSAAFFSTRGGDIAISAGSIEVNRNGAISSQGDTQGRAGDISLDAAGTIILMNGGIVSLSLEGARGERIVANADEILISGPGSRFVLTDFFPEGTGGSINLNVRRTLTILDAGIVSAFTFGRDGADIRVNAGNALISGAGVPSSINTGITAESSSGAGGRGGLIALNIAAALEVLEGGVISTNALGAGPGGEIQIAARDVTVTGRGGEVARLTEQSRGISAQNRSSDPSFINGPSGNIRLLLSGTLNVHDAGEIVVDTIGTGPGGSIEITARDLSIATKGTIAARTNADVSAGAGGDVTINVSDQLQVQAGGLVTAGTFGAGAAGTVTVRGDEISVSGKDARISAVSGAPGDAATGRGGDVSVRANDLSIAKDGQISASTFGPGSGGNIKVVAKTLRITDGESEAFAGISAQTLSLGAGGPGGTVQVDAQSVVMSGVGATITTQSLGGGLSGQIRLATDTLVMTDGSTIQSSSSGPGNAGSVFLGARGAITLNSGSSVQSSSIGTGNAGSITIEASGDIALNGGSSLSVGATQSNAGDINVRSATSITLTGSSITAEAAVNGGNIDVRAKDQLFLTNSQFTAAAGLNGGNIFIDPQFVVLQDSLISANAIRGRGGNIHIISDFFLSSGSAVTATSELGIDGTVRIDALNNDLNDSLVELPSSLLNAESLLQELCTVKVDKFSSFISEGRGGLPPLPGEALPSLMIVK